MAGARLPEQPSCCTGCCCTRVRYLCMLSCAQPYSLRCAVLRHGAGQDQAAGATARKGNGYSPRHKRCLAIQGLSYLGRQDSSHVEEGVCARQLQPPRHTPQCVLLHAHT